MKKIEAIIDPLQLSQVKQILKSDGIGSLTISEIKRADQQVESYRGASYSVDWTRKLRIELLVCDDHADYVVRVIRSAAQASQGRDENVVIVPVHESRAPAS
jgi:nitrogen regulatory protein PII